MISYVVLYLSIVFLITSAAVLALQQLSEASDNIERYRLLRKLGTHSKMVYRSLFIQIAISLSSDSGYGSFLRSNFGGRQYGEFSRRI